MSLTSPELDLDDRWEKWDILTPSCIIDTFKCPVESPGTWEDEWSWEYYVGKQQTSNYSLKYEVICSVGVPQIIWCAGPFKGAAHDKTISELDGICDQLKEEEAICADKAYWGD